jgi:hypothetical protein
VCGKCRLVQLLEMLPAEVLFGTGYSFYSSASPPLSRYHEDYARDVIARYPSQVRQGVVEIGCNDGDLLRHFSHVAHLGVDPSTGPAQMAAERGLNVYPVAFGLDTATDIPGLLDGEKPGVVIANHVLAHVQDVSDCLAGIAYLMDDDSVAMIEVQYLPDLLVNNAFDLVYHEHRNFFSLTTLERAAGQHGLFVLDAEVTDRQGGSLRVTLAKAWKFMAAKPIGLRADEYWLDDLSAYAGMQGRAERIRVRLLDLLAAQRGVVAVYGAPAKATTLLNFCGLTAKDLPWCVDTTPAKQRRHIPGTGIPIYAEDYGEKSRTFLLAAHTYSRGIMTANPNHHWIVPIPTPVLL